MITTPGTSAIDYDPALNRARHTLLRFAAMTFSDPRHGAWQHLAEVRRDAVVCQAAQWMRQEPRARAETLGLGERTLAALDPAAVFDVLPSSADDLNEQYERTFGLLVAGGCPPYETEYVPAKQAFQRAQGLADIAGFYRAFGLRPAAALAERDDHVVLELEFMAALVELERRAADEDDPRREARYIVGRDAQESFLREHLAWWTPAFARLLAREVPGSFYAAGGEFLSALIPAERAVLGVPPFLGFVEPSTLERPEECEHCAVASQL